MDTDLQEVGYNQTLSPNVFALCPVGLALVTARYREPVGVTPLRGGERFIFPAFAGEYVRLERRWQRLRKHHLPESFRADKEAGRKGVNLHDLRTTTITIAYGDFGLEAAMIVGRHKGRTVTERHYVHLSDRDTRPVQRRVADRIAAMLAPPADQLAERRD